MNSSNSDRSSASRDRSPHPPITFEIVHSNGRCSPATAHNLKRMLKQERTDERVAARRWRRDRLLEMQSDRETASTSRRLMREIAEHDRETRKFAAVLRGRVKAAPKPKGAGQQGRSARRPVIGPGPRLPQVSSWIDDDRGMRGVIYRQSYIRRGGKGFYKGCARDHYYYTIRDDAVVVDADGNPIVLTNTGETIEEIGAGWEAIEQATTRANGKIQIRVVLPQDANASIEEMLDAIAIFGKTALDPLGIPYSGVLHQPSPEGDDRNWHAHVLIHLRTVQRIAPYTWGFADEMRGELDGAAGVGVLRHLWAHAATEAAQRSGRNQLYTGLSYIDRQLPIEAGEHLGPMLTAMLRRGEQVSMAERNRLRRARNNARLRVRDFDRKIAALEAIKASLLAPDKDADRQPAWPQAPAATATTWAPAMGEATPPMWHASPSMSTVPNRWSSAKQPLACDAPSPWAQPRVTVPSLPTLPLFEPAARTACVPSVAMRHSRNVAGADGSNRWPATATEALAPLRWERPRADLHSGRSVYAIVKQTRMSVRWAGAVVGGSSRPLPFEWPKLRNATAMPASYRQNNGDPSVPAPGWSLHFKKTDENALELVPWLGASKPQVATAAWPKSIALAPLPTLDAMLAERVDRWREYVARTGKVAHAKTALGMGITIRHDGFGQLTNDPAPRHVPPVPAAAAIAPLDADERPTAALLDLAYWLTKNPRAIVIATDRKITTAAGVDVRVQQLVHQWRDEPEAAALIKKVVHHARHGNEPAWPYELDKDMRARAARDATRPRALGATRTANTITR